MTLLFDFLKNLPPDKKRALSQIAGRGTTGSVWRLLNEQVQAGREDKAAIQHQLGISSLHFDKIVSGLLSKCYQQMFNDDDLGLLRFLSGKVTYTRHFYAELNRQIKQVETETSTRPRSLFYKECLEIIQANLPIANRDEKVLTKLGRKYVALHNGKQRELARLVVAYKLMFIRIQKVFAAGQIGGQQKSFQTKLDRLGPLPANSDEELVFQHYWVRIYFYLAVEKFDTSLELVPEALQALKKFRSVVNKINLLRIEMRSAELLYYLNRFEESFESFNNAFRSTFAAKVPEVGYFTTKFLQVCLITGNIAIAGNIIEKKRANLGEGLLTGIAPRDIISFIKYYLLAGQYEEAYRFLQLGFERNPKSEYFQYELELRNLQTAYFALTGNASLVYQACGKNLKFLRFHGLGVRRSHYPYFFILIKAIVEKKSRYRKFTPREEEMLQCYQRGTYGVYGKLLLKMMGKG